MSKGVASMGSDGSVSPGQVVPETAGGGAAFPITNIAQIALIVKDLDEAVRNWHDRFGIGPWHFYTYGPPLVKRMTRHGEPCEYRMRIALANVGPMRIELIEPLEGDTVYAEFVRDHGYGVHHLGVLVDDMGEALSRAALAGLAMTQDGAGFGPDGDGHYAYLDTEPLMATTIELIERPKRRAAPERVYPPEPVAPDEPRAPVVAPGA